MFRSAGCYLAVIWQWLCVIWHLRKTLVQLALDHSALPFGISDGPKISLPCPIWQDHETGASVRSCFVHAGHWNSSSISVYVGILAFNLQTKPQISHFAEGAACVESTSTFHMKTSRQYTFFGWKDIEFDSKGLSNPFFKIGQFHGYTGRAKLSELPPDPGWIIVPKNKEV
ncbi:hypothetical protein B0H13DRAFT_1901272 [Mycena leptocephala]|nr:hypothetical protein B0H13DRAFT_1901272 [Mycena leptocephala]